MAPTDPRLLQDNLLNEARTIQDQARLDIEQVRSKASQKVRALQAKAAGGARQIQAEAEAARRQQQPQAIDTNVPQPTQPGFQANGNVNTSQQLQPIQLGDPVLLGAAKGALKDRTGSSGLGGEGNDPNRVQTTTTTGSRSIAQGVPVVQLLLEVFGKGQKPTTQTTQRVLTPNEIAAQEADLQAAKDRQAFEDRRITLLEKEADRKRELDKLDRDRLELQKRELRLKENTARSQLTASNIDLGLKFGLDPNTAMAFARIANENPAAGREFLQSDPEATKQYDAFLERLDAERTAALETSLANAATSKQVNQLATHNLERLETVEARTARGMVNPLNSEGKLRLSAVDATVLAEEVGNQVVGLKEGALSAPGTRSAITAKLAELSAYHLHTGNALFTVRIPDGQFGNAVSTRVPMADVYRDFKTLEKFALDLPGATENFEETIERRGSAQVRAAAQNLMDNFGLTPDAVLNPGSAKGSEDVLTSRQDFRRELSRFVMNSLREKSTLERAQAVVKSELEGGQRERAEQFARPEFREPKISTQAGRREQIQNIVELRRQRNEEARQKRRAALESVVGPIGPFGSGSPARDEAASRARRFRQRAIDNLLNPQ